MMQDMAKPDLDIALLGAGLAPTHSNVPQYGHAFSKVQALSIHALCKTDTLYLAAEAIRTRHKSHSRIQQHLWLLPPIGSKVIDPTNLPSRGFLHQIRPLNLVVPGWLRSVAPLLRSLE
jgi:hypothetical protein